MVTEGVTHMKHKQFLKNTKRLIVLVLLFVVACTTSGQGRRRTPPVFGGSSAAPQLEALGARGQAQGTELTRFVGKYIDEIRNRKMVQVIHQLPNLVALRGFAPGGRELKFNGNRHATRLTTNEEALLEVFVSDTTEGMLNSLQTGAAVRLLGRGFKPGWDVVPGYVGAAYDIYEVTATLPFDGRETVRTKFYYFDNTTGLLLSTRYDDVTVQPALRVETRFSGWRTVDGSAYPGRIERYENNRRVFSFVTGEVAGGPSVDVSNFR